MIAEQSRLEEARTKQAEWYHVPANFFEWEERRIQNMAKEKK